MMTSVKHRQPGINSQTLSNSWMDKKMWLTGPVEHLCLVHGVFKGFFSSRGGKKPEIHSALLNAMWLAPVMPGTESWSMSFHLSMTWRPHTPSYYQVFTCYLTGNLRQLIYPVPLCSFICGCGLVTALGLDDWWADEVSMPHWSFCMLPGM